MHTLMITPAFVNFYEHSNIVLNDKENIKILNIKESFTITTSTTTLHVSTPQRNTLHDSQRYIF